MVDEAGVVSISEERVFQGVTAFVQSELRVLLRDLKPAQVDFLRMRAITSSDARAAHLLGHVRNPDKDPHPEKVCNCGEHKVGWVDLRVGTIMAWKKEEAFSNALHMLLTEPLIYAAAHIQGLAPKAVGAYDDLLDPGMKPEVRRQAARDVIEAVGLKATPGVEGSGKGIADQFGYKVALERYRRNLELSDAQRELLKAGGVDLEELAGPAEGVERDLDGNDVLAAELLPD